MRGPAKKLGAGVGEDFGGDLGAGVGGDLNEDLGAGVGEDFGKDSGFNKRLLWQHKKLPGNKKLPS